MGLVELRDGSKGVVSGVNGGRRVRQQLLDLGIVPGVPVTIVRKSGAAPMLVSLMGRQLVIDQRIAKNVCVRPESVR